MRTTAAVVPAPGRDFVFEDLEIDDPRDDEILVRIAAVGICHTDLVAREGAGALQFPAVLGHEGAGVVTRVGSTVGKVAVGDRVALTFRSCGTCAMCLRGSPAYCHTMPVLNYTGLRPDGSKALRQGETAVSSNFFGQSSFATYALAYERNVIKLPQDIPFELAAPLGCGVQTGAGSIMLAMACPAGSTLLITGGGAVGLSAVMAGVIQGCSRIIVVEPHQARRDLALALGATDVLEGATGDALTAQIRAILPTGVDFAFDTTGRPDVMAGIMNGLAPKGTLGYVGIPPLDAPPPGLLIQIMGLGQSIRGIIEGDSEPDVFLPQLIELWRAGRLPLEQLVKTFPFAQINAAIEAQHRGDCVKVVLTMPES